MKIRLLLVLAVLLVGGVLVACGSESDSSDSANANGDTTATGTGSEEVVLTSEGIPQIEEFCPDEPTLIGLSDGFGGNSWREIQRAEFEDAASVCPNIETTYADGGGDPQKTNAQINGMVAQGADAIITFADFGPAELPAIKKATRAGVKVVPNISTVGGTPGVDYVDFITPTKEEIGEKQAEFFLETIGEEGKLIYLGGTPGNPNSDEYYGTVRDALADHPDLRWVEDPPIDTNWDPAKAQQIMTGLVAKHDDIAGVVTDFSATAVSAIRAFQNAGQPIPPIATQDQNQLGCLHRELSKSNPDFELLTYTAGTSFVRLALAKALAAMAGEPDAVSSTPQLPVVEDTLAGMEPKCDKALPPDAVLSSGLNRDELVELFGN